LKPTITEPANATPITRSRAVASNGVQWKATFINGMQLKAACVTIIAATPASSQRFNGAPSNDKERLTERQLKR
jgi:hypothetical protein